MDNEQDKEHEERRGSNTDYVPTKCRITKPPPPKPATNPLQFIKVAPCPLFQKAQEQIKKVEEIKKERKEVREEAEDWQANLDNWKSSRRKRQEHIIERVVEVKKFAEEDRQRKKSKTFSEMIEDRTKGRRKFSIPVFEDDSNDLSDYGIGSSSSKTNSIKDVDTDDSGSILDDRDNSSEFPQTVDIHVSNQRHKENEDTDTILSSSNLLDNDTNFYNNNQPLNTWNDESSTTKQEEKVTEHTKENNLEQYTYEGAIQDYRSRIRSKINIDESIFTSTHTEKEPETQILIPISKGEIFKRKELFEGDKTVEIKTFESIASRRLSEDFVNSQSIKQRLKSLELSKNQSSNITSKDDVQLVSVRERLQNFNKQSENNTNNNNNNNNNTVTGTSTTSSKPAKISNFLIRKSHSSSTVPFSNGVCTSTSTSTNTSTNTNTNNTSTPNNHTKYRMESEMIYDRSSSPETEIYMNKLNMFNRDLDNLMMYKKGTMDLRSDEVVTSNSDYTSSTELLGGYSDRDDSGINTADVSCSVSQTEEPIEAETSCLFDASASKNETRKMLDDDDISNTRNVEVLVPAPSYVNTIKIAPPVAVESGNSFLTKSNIINCTLELLNSLKIDSSENLHVPKFALPFNDKQVTDIASTSIMGSVTSTCTNMNDRSQEKPVVYKDSIYESVIYENIEIKPSSLRGDEKHFIPTVDFITTDILAADNEFPLTAPKLEPPKVKPPPPPPSDDSIPPPIPPPPQIVTSVTSRRFKDEMSVKRSSFLGLDSDSIAGDKPPFDVAAFLQRSPVKRVGVAEENRLLLPGHVASSQDSGLDIDRGRLSSDTWCSSIGDSVSLPSHSRQDSSDHTNSITSEEEEIMKKEREIIEMVEKEEKSRDGDVYDKHYGAAPDDTTNLSNSYFSTNGI